MRSGCQYLPRISARASERRVEKRHDRVQCKQKGTEGIRRGPRKFPRGMYVSVGLILAEGPGERRNLLNPG